MIKLCIIHFLKYSLSIRLRGYCRSLFYRRILRVSELIVKLVERISVLYSFPSSPHYYFIWLKFFVYATFLFYYQPRQLFIIVIIFFDLTMCSDSLLFSFVLFVSLCSSLDLDCLIMNYSDCGVVLITFADWALFLNGVTIPDFLRSYSSSIRPLIFLGFYGLTVLMCLLLLMKVKQLSTCFSFYSFSLSLIYLPTFDSVFCILSAVGANIYSILLIISPIF